MVAKAQLIYKLPWNFLVSGNLQHQTGRPWARQVRVSGLGFPSNPTIYMEPLDGSRRVPSLDLIDARVQKTIPLGSANLDLFLDMLNLTNTDATENVLSRRGDQRQHVRRAVAVRLPETAAVRREVQVLTRDASYRRRAGLQSVGFCLQARSTATRRPHLFSISFSRSLAAANRGFNSSVLRK